MKNGLVEFVDGRPGWWTEAMCRGMDAELFFPKRGDGKEHLEAVAVCEKCPVKENCLEYAIVNRERHGVWGGKSERQRRMMRSRRFK